MDVHTIVLTNGRGACLARMMESYETYVGTPSGTIVDDSGDSNYREYLERDYPGWRIAPVADEACGYSAAMQKVWSIAAEHEYVFLIEDDFVFQRAVSPGLLAEILDKNPHLFQFVLVRQPWFPHEVAAGSLLASIEGMGFPLNLTGTNGNSYLTHLRGWSTNPTVFRGSDWVRDRPWPEGEGSEYRFGLNLVQDEPGRLFAYWGDGSEYVEHIGQRTGFGH